MPDVTSEEQVQEAILAYLDETLAQQVIEQTIPNSKTVLRNEAGDLDPYFAVQFGDLQEGATHNLGGVTGDDYIIPVYAQAIAPQPRIARRMANRMRLAMLGMSFEWTGSIRKRPGGGMFPITSSNGATEAYVSPASFGVPLQYMDLID